MEVTVGTALVVIALGLAVGLIGLMYMLRNSIEEGRNGRGK